MMRKLAGGLLALGLTFGMAACGGVDKKGTANNLIAAIEKAGSKLDATGKTCITSLVNSYSDADLKTLFAKLNDPVAARSFLSRALRLNPNFSPTDAPVAVAALRRLGVDHAMNGTASRRGRQEASASRG